MAAALLIAGALNLGCGRTIVGTAPLDGNRAPAAGALSVPMTHALVLVTSGAAPHDTSVTFRAGEAQTIVMLHPTPDPLVFAEVAFAPTTFAADSGRDIVVWLRARPGVYGLDIETSAPIGAGASLTFRYSRHFAAPAGAHATHGSDVAYERALAVAHLGRDSLLTFLPSTRPAADHLSATLSSAGTYFAAAPR